MKSFLLIGQSNMAGRGDFGEVKPIRNPKCLMLRNGRWQPMNEPICFDRGIEPVGKFGFHSGVSLAASFADRASEYFNDYVGLIPCAEGNTSITEWQSGELLFDHAIALTKLAMRTSTLSGILWHQGENDSVSEISANNYYSLFMKMYNSLFDSLGIGKIPFIVGELGEFTANYPPAPCKYYKTVNASLHRIANEIPYGAIATAWGLTCRCDSVHFDSKSLRILGVRYFEAYKKVYERNYLQ